MKILQIFGAVVAVHLLAFIFIFASPGCQSGPRTMPTPDATVPVGGPITPAPEATGSYPGAIVNPQPLDLGTAPAYSQGTPGGHASPTRPGSANAVAVTPAKPVAENVAPVASYTVERGDSLWSIAKKHNMTVAELAKANSITTGTALKPGRKLIVPVKPGATPPPADMTAPAASTAPAAAAASSSSRAAAGEGVKHTVQVGESLGVIARKYQVTVGELAAANSITDPSKVRAGQQLVIPGYKGASKSPAKATTASKPASNGARTPASAATTPATANTPASAPSTQTPVEPAAAAPHFDLTPPPPGQDLDAGLKPTETEVPTIKVEDPSAPKN